MDLTDLIKVTIVNGIRIGMEEAYRECGKVSGELSYRQAKKLYGTPFVEAEAKGDFKPCRLAGGAKVIKYYDTLEWLKYKAEKQINAQII